MTVSRARVVQSDTITHTDGPAAGFSLICCVCGSERATLSLVIVVSSDTNTTFPGPLPSTNHPSSTDSQC